MTEASLDMKPSLGKKLRQQVFGLDFRSLAVFRIVVGVLILIDLYDRSLYLVDFYTDDGFLTRSLVGDYLGQMKPPSEKPADSIMPWPFWSFHLLSGEVWVAQLLFGLQAVLAVVLMVGWKTRFFTLANWLILISLHARNPIVLNSGDTILRMMLFWSLFLPLGAKWSIDAWLQKGRPRASNPHVSMASAAFIIQLCTMYWFTGWSKMNDIWFQGEAIRNVLHLNIVCRPLGKYLLEYPTLLELMCYVTVWLEFAAPFLLFVPWKTAWIRTGLIATFVGFHLGIVLTMTVGLFSAISMICWIALLPADFWNARWVQKWILWKREDPSQNPTSDMTTATISNQRSWSAKLGYGGLQLGCGLVLVYVLLWNVWRVQPNHPQLARLMPVSLRPMGQALMLAQEFKMFDTPPALDYWFMYEGQLRNGKKVELFTGQPLPDGKPTDLYSRYRDHRWRRLHVNFLHQDYELLREPLTNYLVTRWNESHSDDEQVTRCFFRCYQESTGADAAPGNLLSHTWVEIQLEEADPFAEMLRALENGGSIFP